MQQITSEKIKQQINKLKEQIEKKYPKDSIKEEQNKLNQMLKKYLDSEN